MFLLFMVWRSFGKDDVQCHMFHQCFLWYGVFQGMLLHVLVCVCVCVRSLWAGRDYVLMICKSSNKQQSPGDVGDV